MIWLATACFSLRIQAQEQQHISGYLVPMCVYEGDTIPCVQLRTVYIFRPLKFKNDRQRRIQAQEQQHISGYLVPMCVYEGDTIPCVQLRTVYIFRPLKFKNDRQRREYNRLVRNVKKVYPISKEINRAIIETYEYLQTLPDEKARQKHIKRVHH